MASIEAMTKEATRSLTIRVKRLAGAAKELEAAQDMDRRAVARLAAAELAQDTLIQEIADKSDLVARLVGDTTADDVLDGVYAELGLEHVVIFAEDESADDTGEATEEEGPADGDAPVKRARKSKTAEPVSV
jgi:hypothetical protein